MAFANPNVSDLIATSIEQRSRKIADNVANNNAILAQLREKGRVASFSGGRIIYEELSFAANPNGGWYSGYDTLSVGPADVLTAAEFSIKQYAVPVVVSGLETLQNSGKEALIDLVSARLDVAESTMANDLSTGLYSDGTGSGGKQIVGLDAAVSATPTTGTYGNINRATYTFWRNQTSTVSSTTSTIQNDMNVLWAKCVRGADRPDLILTGGTRWASYMASLQLIQRFTDPQEAKLGFPSVKFMDADVVLDGGIGGGANATTMYFLNTKYLRFRPHKDRNMVPLDPSRRFAFNQDASVQILAFAGALTCSGAQFQGRGIFA